MNNKFFRLAIMPDAWNRQKKIDICPPAAGIYQKSDSTTHQAIIILAVFFSLIIVSCGVPDKPIEFALGEHQCEYCNMGIADRGFRGEIITSKGKVHYFDSIECLTAWKIIHTPKVNKVWVANFVHQDKWIELQKAKFLQSKELKSPMGAGLIAYKSKESLLKGVEEYKGRALTYSELITYIKNWLLTTQHTN